MDKLKILEEVLREIAGSAPVPQTISFIKTESENEDSKSGDQSEMAAVDLVGRVLEALMETHGDVEEGVVKEEMSFAEEKREKKKKSNDEVPEVIYDEESPEEEEMLSEEDWDDETIDTANKILEVLSVAEYISIAKTIEESLEEGDEEALDEEGVVYEDDVLDEATKEKKRKKEKKEKKDEDIDTSYSKSDSRKKKNWMIAQLIGHFHSFATGKKAKIHKLRLMKDPEALLQYLKLLNGRLRKGDLNNFYGEFADIRDIIVSRMAANNASPRQAMTYVERRLFAALDLLNKPGGEERLRRIINKVYEEPPDVRTRRVWTYNPALKKRRKGKKVQD